MGMIARIGFVGLSAAVLGGLFTGFGGCQSSMPEGPTTFDLAHLDLTQPPGPDFSGIDFASTDLATSCAGADLMNDSNNCGRCARSCGAGVCALGACPVTTLFPNVVGPTSLAVDGTGLYWASYPDGATGSINKGLLNGLAGGSPVPIDSNIAFVGDVVVANSKLYWAVGGNGDGMGAIRTSPATGSPTPTDFAANESSPLNVATDGTKIYWSTEGTSTGGFTDGAIRVKAISSGAAMDLGSATGLAHVGNIAVAANTVFYTLEGSSPAFSDGSINRIPTVGGTVTPIATSQMHPYGVAADATIAVWVNTGDNTVVKQPWAMSTGASPVATAQNLPFVALVDTTGIYYANSPDDATGTIMFVPLSGGTPIAFATGQKAPFKIVSDLNNIYWANNGTSANGYTDGAIMKTVK